MCQVHTRGGLALARAFHILWWSWVMLEPEGECRAVTGMTGLCLELVPAHRMRKTCNNEVVEDGTLNYVQNVLDRAQIQMDPVLGVGCPSHNHPWVNWPSKCLSNAWKCRSLPCWWGKTPGDLILVLPPQQSTASIALVHTQSMQTGLGFWLCCRGCAGNKRARRPGKTQQHCHVNA